MKLQTTIIPEGDKIVVLPSKPEEVTSAGIVIPDSKGKREKPQRGKVLAISEYLTALWGLDFSARSGNDGGFIPPERKIRGLAEGDEVLFPQYAGDDIKVKDLESGEEVTIKVLPAESILGRCQKNEE